MIVLPNIKDNYVNLLGIDPGSLHSGICNMKVNILTSEIVETIAYTVDIQKLPNINSFTVSIEGERKARLIAFEQYLIDLFNNTSPYCVSVESPFYNPSRPNAFAALLETMASIENAYRHYNCWSTINKIDPSTVKKTIGVTGKTKGIDSKTLVQNIIYKMSDVLKYRSHQPINQLDEHSIDAIAVCYWSYKTIFLNTT